MPSGVAAPGGAVVVTASGATPFATPTTVCAGAPPRQPFPNAQYGPPPPGAAILGAGGAVTPTPSSHGPSPTPSSGSGGGSFVASGYAGRSKFGRMRGNSRQPMATPPTSPAKNRGKGKQAFFCPSSVLLWYPSTITGFGSALTNFLFITLWLILKVTVLIGVRTRLTVRQATRFCHLIWHLSVIRPPVL